MLRSRERRVMRGPARANCKLSLAEFALCTPEAISGRCVRAQLISAQSPTKRPIIGTFPAKRLLIETEIFQTRIDLCLRPLRSY